MNVPRAPDLAAREPAAPRSTEFVPPPRPSEASVDTSQPTLRVRFVDQDANPIPGVRLHDAARPHSTVAADRAGVATLALQATQDPLDLVARAPGLATARRRVLAPPTEEAWLEDWTLVPAGIVSGRVLEENGSAIVGARVGVAEAEGPGRSTSWEDTLTRADGSFELAAFPAGARRLIATADGREPAMSEPLDVPRDGRLDAVEIRMQATGSGTALSGIVRAPSGEPVAGARVEVAAGKSSYTVFTGSDGTFRVDPQAQVRCRLLATDPLSRYGEAALEDVPAGRSGIELRLEAAPTVTLVVRGAERPVETFWALALAEDDRALVTLHPDARSDGRASFARPTARFRVEVHANGWRPAHLGPFEPDATTTIECTLEPASGVHGRVLRGEVALRGAIVTLHPALTTETVYNGFPVRSDRNPWNQTLSAADGTFALSVEERGDYYVRAEAPGLAPAEIGPLPLDPDVEHEADLVVESGGTVAVRVRSSAGRGVAGTLVALSRGDGDARTWHCDGNGELVVDTLTPGPWQVELAESELDPRFGASQFGTGPVRAIPSNCVVRAGETTRVDLWLEDRGSKACQISGRFTIDGEPASGFLASLVIETRPGAPIPFHEDGLFRLRADEPGSCGLMLLPADPDPRRALLVRDAVELFEGELHWSADLDTGVLDTELPATATVAANEQLYLHWSRGTLEVFVPLAPDEGGRVHHERTPLGPARLVRVRADQLLESHAPTDLGALEAAPR